MHGKRQSGWRRPLQRVGTNRRAGGVVVNEREHDDYLFYDPRRWGINLKWLRDAGKFNDAPWYTEIDDYIGGFLSELGGLGKELLGRLIGVADFLFSFVGLMLESRLRLRVVILRDGARPGPGRRRTFIPGESDKQLQNLDDAINLAKEIFKAQTNTKILAWDDQMVLTLDFPAPTAALTGPCGGGAWTRDFKRAGSYFRRHSAALSSIPSPFLSSNRSRGSAVAPWGR